MFCFAQHMLTDWDRRGAADVLARSRREDAVTALSDDGARGVRNELAGTGDGVRFRWVSSRGRYMIRQIVRDSGDMMYSRDSLSHPVFPRRWCARPHFRKVCEAWCGIPTGAAHALDSRAFAVAVMGKTGTTNEFAEMRLSWERPTATKASP